MRCRRLSGDTAKIIDPAAVSFVADHAGGDDQVVQLPDEKPFRIDAKFSLDVLTWIVVRHDQITGCPKRNDGFLVGGTISPDKKIGWHACLTRKCSYRAGAC